MIRLVAANLIALVMMGGLAMPVQADTVSTSGTLTGSSTTTPTANPAVFNSNFTGSGMDSVSGAFTTTNTTTVIFSSSTAFTESGTFVDFFAGGTTFGTLSENGTVSGNTVTFKADAVTTGGTGIFTGDTGQSTITGTCTATSPTTSSCTGTYTGFITIPEPSSLALMLAGIGFLPLNRKRLARGRQAP